MLLSQEKPISAQPVPPKLSSKETVRKVLEGRGVEVLETARRYYPKETAQIEHALADLIESGKLKGPVSGVEFYSFLMRIGMACGVDVQIRVTAYVVQTSLEEMFSY